MNGNRRWLKAALIVTMWAGCAGAVFAQSMNAGDIRGIVTDPSGAAVPGVAVSIVNKNTGVAKDLVTNSDGLYDTSSIVTGSYEITFSKAGFEKLVRSNITIDVGNFTVNAQLSIGAVTEQVIVNTDLALLQTENAEQSTTLEAAKLQQLPEVGQDSGKLYDPDTRIGGRAWRFAGRSKSWTGSRNQWKSAVQHGSCGRRCCDAAIQRKRRCDGAGDNSGS